MVPQISPRETRWILGPIEDKIYAAEVAERFHKEVVPTVFGDTVHWTCIDLGKKAGMVKVIRVPVTPGVGMDLVSRMILYNQNHLTGRWRGERPAIRISQNNRENTGNIKLEVADWDVAKKLVMDGVMVGKKKCKVKLWAQSNRNTNKRRVGRFPTPPPQHNTNKRPGTGNSPGRGFRCYGCGDGGHLIAQCTKKERCDRCGGWGHNARDCQRIQHQLHFGKGKETSKTQTSRNIQEPKGKTPSFLAGPLIFPKAPTAAAKEATPKTTESVPPKMGQFTAPPAPKPSKSGGWVADPIKNTW